MKPLKLKIKGLNSFIEEETVDFKKLTSRGMFGIFGPTGSGKSTILDGITLALYGEVSRKSSNFINTNCNSCNVSFEFQISGNFIKRYIVSREYKRDKKTGSIQSAKCRLVDITDDEIVLADKVREVNEKCKEILGLSLEDFTRTVVLPQGKFSEFLKLEGKNRREMLERLFNLEKYGDELSSKLLRELSKVRTDKNILDGQMKGYEEYSTERLENLKISLDTITCEYNNISKECKEISVKDKEISEIYLNMTELKKLKEQETYFLNLKDEISLKKEKLSLSERAGKIYPSIKEFDQNKKDIEKLNKENEDLSLRLQSQVKKKDEILERWMIYKEKNDKELPTLKIKEDNYEEAINQNNELKKLESEISKLRNFREELIKKNEKSKNQLLKVEENLKINLEKENKIDKEIESLKVDRALKEKVQAANIYINDYNSLNKQYEDCKKSILEMQNKKDIIKEQCDNEMIQFDKTSKLLLLVNKENEKLNGQDILSEKELLVFQKEIMNLEDSLRNKNMINSKKSDLNKVINEEKIKSEEYLSKISEIKQKRGVLEQKLEHLKTFIYSSFIRERLKENEPCPVCGNIHVNISSYHNEKIDNKKIDAYNNEKERLENMEKDLNVKISLSKRIIDEKQNEIKSIEDDLKDINQDVSKEFIDQKKSVLDIKIKDLQNYRINLENNQKSEKETKEKYILLQNNIKNFNNNIFDLNKRIENSSRERDDINHNIKDILEKIDILKEQTNTTDFLKKNKELLLAEDKRNDLISIQKKVKMSSEELRSNKINLMEEVSNLEKRIEKGKAVIEEKQCTIKNKTDYLLNRLDLDVTDASSIFDIIQNKLNDLKIIIKDIETNYNLVQKEKDNIENILENLRNMSISLISKISEISNRNEKLDKNIILLMKEEEFTSREDVILSIINEEEKNNLNNDIQKYNTEFSENQGAIKRVIKILNGRTITETQYNDFNNNKEEKNKLLNSKNEERIKCIEEYKNVKIKVKELSDLYDKASKLNHRYSLLTELEKLFKGKRFIEYIATSRLKYISIEASKRLYSITNGNYGLEVNDDGKFFIRDFKNGGVSRDTSTLSGGETFLASLSLALSLSAEIQLKGTAPLELFFLDEGFGTLDDDLLDIVMSSLERIHNEKLKIGIISHVDAIKNRVPIKLLIAEAKSGICGSKISIQYS